MAARWSNLSGDILSIIANLLETDVHLLRLRSVCSSWRSSLSPPKKRFSFPLKLPPLPHSGVRIQDPDGYFVLKEKTLYRLSPPADGDRAADPSSGWLFKVSETNSNRFCLLNPINSNAIEDTEGVIPKTLNLLDYRISEICKSYSIVFVSDSSEYRRLFIFRKVIVLWNYVTGCDLAVIVLPFGKGINIWKFGDKSWTRLGTQGFRLFEDVIQHGEKCYAIDMNGRIVYIDSSLNMTDVCLPARHLRLGQNYLTKCGPDLFMISINVPGPEGEHLDSPLNIKVFKLSKDLESGIIPEFRDETENLEDKVFFLADDASVGVSAKDFAGCKGNYICLTDGCFYGEGSSGAYGEYNGIYDFGEKIIEPFAKVPGYAKIFWPPPKWLMRDEVSTGCF